MTRVRQTYEGGKDAVVLLVPPALWQRVLELAGPQTIPADLALDALHRGLVAMEQARRQRRRKAGAK